MASIDATLAITTSATSVLMSSRMLQGDRSRRLRVLNSHSNFGEYYLTLKSNYY